jgi:hypothetical protein
MISNVRNGAVRAMTLGVPEGPDLAASPSSGGRVTISANLVG